MKKIILTIALLSNSFITQSSELPDWVMPKVKNFAIDQLVDVMQDGPFYKITNISLVESESETGAKTASAIIDFDDSLGCNDRFLETDCLPQPDGALACFMTLSDCLPNKIVTLKKIKVPTL